jgi:hypothetical protein
MNKNKSRRPQTSEFKKNKKYRNHLGNHSPSGSIRIQGYTIGRVNTNVRIFNTVSIVPGFRLGSKKNFCPIESVANTWIGVNRTRKTILLIRLFQNNFISGTPKRCVLYNNTI